MFELLPASVDPGFHAAGAGELCEQLARYRRNENISACAQVFAAAALWYERLREETVLVESGGRIAVGNSVYAEIGSILGCSATVAHTMVEIGTVLESRFPTILDSFDTGTLDYQRVRVVVAVLGQASDDTLAMIDTDVHAAAVHLTPGPLRAELWRLWTTVAPTEARAARERLAVEKRTAYVRRGPDGLSWLTAAITDIEGAEADRLLDDIAATVCEHDPRSRNVLRADGLMALLHGESFLTCRCGATGCPNATPAAPRRGHLTQILVDAATLLGLANNPARLGDGTPIDPDLARALAEDSQWQAILTELRTTLDQYDSTVPGMHAGSADTGADSVEPEHDPTTETSESSASPPWAEAPQSCAAEHDSARMPHAPAPCSTNAAHTETIEPAVAPTEPATRPSDTTDTWTTEKLDQPETIEPEEEPTTAPHDRAPTTESVGSNPATETAGRQHDHDTSRDPSAPKQPTDPNPGAAASIQTQARQVALAWWHAIGRTRVRTGGIVRFGSPALDAPATPGVGVVIDAWLAAIAADPALRTGIDPAGHGGHRTPPAGALRYRPSAALAALVRATYATCVFPGCCTPSTKCELDHRVPFDHDDPERGGHTILENLEPLCKRHHDIKSRRLWTCVPLGGGVILWTSPHHTHRITLPTLGAIGIPQPPEPLEPDEYELIPEHGPGYTDDDLLYEPTWWEEIIGFDEPAPTARELAAEPYLHHRYRQHQAVTERRKQLQPAPF